MVSRIQVSIPANDRSYFAILKKQIHAMAVEAGFSRNRINEIDLVVAELVSNLVKHAGGGDLLVKLIEKNKLQGLEIISIDNGPGIADVMKMTADGVSTKNTLGHGLGSIKRLSNFFQVYSIPKWGTIQLIRIFDSAPLPRKNPEPFTTNSILLPKPGESACGDGFFLKKSGTHISWLLGDGLGHGPDAESAVMKAGESFMNCQSVDPPEIIRHISQDVKKTRGLVGTVVVFDIINRKWRICGIGNVATKLTLAGNSKNYLAYNGIIGLKLPNTLNTQEIDYQAGHYITMCSDGIKSRWDLQKYQSIQRYDPSILCAAVLKDFNRNNDDVSIVHCQIHL